MSILEIFRDGIERELLGLIVGCFIGVSFVVVSQVKENKRLNKALNK